MNATLLIHLSPAKQSTASTSVPIILWVIGGALLLVSISGFEFMGFRATGWAWFVILVIALWISIVRVDRISFPMMIWMPWMALVGVGLARSWFAGVPVATQNTAQILCPIVVGMALSTYRFEERDLGQVIGLLCKLGAVFLIGLVLIKMPLLLAGRLPMHTPFAAESISALLFQALFLAFYFTLGRPRYLLLYAAMLCVPVVAMTRGPILASAMLAVFLIAPARPMTRAAIVGIGLICGLAVFNTDRFQSKMFYDGEHRTVIEVLENPDDVADSGRKALWEMFDVYVQAAPVFGHGVYAANHAMKENGYQLREPHNDWLKIRVDLGLFGVLVFALTLAVQVVHMVTKASTAGPNMRALSFGAVSAFAPFVVVMYVDNPLVYVQYFGNLQFAILGICYGSLAVGGSHQWSLKLRSVNAALEVEEIPEPTEEGNSNAHPNRT